MREFGFIYFLDFLFWLLDDLKLVLMSSISLIFALNRLPVE